MGPRLIEDPEMEMLPIGVSVILAEPHLISRLLVPSIEIEVPPLIVTPWLPSIVMSPLGFSDIASCDFCSTFPFVSTVRSLSDLIVITSFACMTIFWSDCSEKDPSWFCVRSSPGLAVPFQSEPRT